VEMISLLLYSLNAPTWTARKLDKKTTNDVKKANGVKEDVDAGNFNKMILPDCDELDALKSHITSVRQQFYLRTAPWGETRGVRVGKAENHMELFVWFGDRKAELAPLLKTFGSVYQSKIALAEYQLHDMFNAEDYPPWETVESKFGLRLSCQPLPNVEDVRVLEEIPEHVRKEIEESILSDANNAFTIAVREAFEIMLKPVAHMAKQLKGYQDGTAKKLYNSITENVETMAAAARRLNVARDPQLEQLADAAEKLVAGVTAKELKESDGFRVQKMKEAQKLADRIAKFMP
jgi:hypothetical protein